MAFKVGIKGHDGPVTVEMGQSILDAGIEEGAPFPYSCRSGNCGTCKCRLLSGEVEMSPFSEFALSKAEEENGLILACRAVPWSDCEIELIGDDDQVVHPSRDMICRVAAAEDLTHDIRSVELEILSGGPFTYSPGQYADVAFPGLPGRHYSMAGQPEEERLRFYIRILPQGRVSDYLGNRLKVGDEARVKGPYGSAFLREGRKGPILAIAGGSGLAPIRSIVDRAVAIGWEDPIHVYFGVRSERDLYCEDHFRALSERCEDLRFEPILSEPDGGTDRRTGLVTDALRADFETLEGFIAYLAGPPPMIEAAETLLPDLGVPRTAIHADAFYTEAELERGAAE